MKNYHNHSHYHNNNNNNNNNTTSELTFAVRENTMLITILN